MKIPTKSYFLVALLLFATLLSACGAAAPTPTIQPAPTPSPTIPASNNTATPDEVGSSPQGVVQKFLDLIYGPDAGKQANEEAVRKLLANNMLLHLGDESAISLIGHKYTPSGYKVERSAEPEVTIPEQAYFDATINFAEGSEVHRFSLILSGEGWLISGIERVSPVPTATAIS